MLLVTVYALRPLDFAMFPSMLLIATLFRLSLNIAATRLILSDADAGRVIETIGTHVVAGNYVIGMIVFVVVQSWVDIFGHGDYVQPFVAKLNERGSEYAAFSLNDDGPSYPFMRHLGYEIQQIMGSEHENRWVIDQVMDKDGYEVYQQISRVIDGLF